MPTFTRNEITLLLAALRNGEQSALKPLIRLLYDELKLAAHQQLRRRRPGQTLDTTALVHEVYLRLADQSHPGWHDRRHFLAVSAMAMRQILVDHARRRAAYRRGGEMERVPLEESRVGAATRAVELLALDEALGALAERDERLVRVIELHYFLGLSFAETGEVLGLNERTARRDWTKARAFLYRALHGGGTEQGAGR